MKKKYIRWCVLIIASPFIAIAAIVGGIVMSPIVLGYWLFAPDGVTLWEAFDDVMSVPPPR